MIIYFLGLEMIFLVFFSVLRVENVSKISKRHPFIVSVHQCLYSCIWRAKHNCRNIKLSQIILNCPKKILYYKTIIRSLSPVKWSQINIELSHY